MMIQILLLFMALSVRSNSPVRPSDPTRGPGGNRDRLCGSREMILKCGLFNGIPPLCYGDEKPTCNKQDVTVPTRAPPDNSDGDKGGDKGGGGGGLGGFGSDLLDKAKDKADDVLDKGKDLLDKTKNSGGGTYSLNCPSCVPPQLVAEMCLERPSEECEVQTKPTLKFNPEKGSLCPSCFKIPKYDENRCSLEQTKACIGKMKDGTVPTCPEDGTDEPTLTDDCCFSCVRKIPDQAKTLCPEREKALPDCERITMYSMNITRKQGNRDLDGCRICAPPSVVRDIGEKCLTSDFLEFKEGAAECDAEERPTLDENSTRCGPPCVRQASKKHLLQVIACRKNLPECEDDDRTKRTIFLPEEACPICEPKRPSCGCDDDKICVINKELERNCVGKKRFAVRLKLKDTIRSQLKNSSEETTTGVLKEMVERYCERNEEAERCGEHRDTILDSIKTTAKRNFNEDGDEMELELEVAEGQGEMGEREQKFKDIVSLVEDAIKDDETYVRSIESSDPSDIPAEKQCFNTDQILKCKLGGVSMEYCTQTRPTCEKQQATDRQDATFLISCPSCIPKAYVNNLCKERVSTVCSDNQVTAKWNQQKQSICPSCIKIQPEEEKPEEDKCTWQKRKSCLDKLKDNSLPTCVDGEVARQDGCCFSCLLKKQKQEDKCPDELPECEVPQNEKTDMREAVKKLGQRDDNGCRKCAPKSPVRNREQKCSREDFQAYKELAPTCSSGENGILRKDNNRCGPTCVRQASKKHLLEVIACSKDLPPCEDGDKTKRSIFLPDDACPICEPQRPQCSSCQDNEVCIRGKEGVPKCIGKKKFVMRMKLKAAVKKEIRGLKKPTVTRLLKEMLQRYCERPGAIDKCEKFKERIIDSIKCTKKELRNNTDDEVDFTIEMAKGGMEPGRRLLAEEDDTTNLLLDAVRDDSTYVVSAQDNANPPPNPSQDGSPDGSQDGSTGTDPNPPSDIESSSSAILFSISFLLSMIGISQF